MSSAPPDAVPQDEDERTLHRLGYAQVLYREMGGFSNFAISFTIISILAGCLTSYFIGFNDGGPVAVVWGWLLVGGFVTLIALGMAEIASSMPTAGALYYWASKLGSPAWGWFTGWFNLIGQIGVTAAIDYGAAIFWTALMNLFFPSVGTDTHTVFITFSAIMAAHLLLNLLGIRILAAINSISAWWHMVGVTVIVLVLAFVPDHHQSVSFVFTKTLNASGFSGSNFSTPVFWFVFGIGLLMAQYTYTGYDASAHMSEETQSASRAAAWGVVMSVVMSVIFGFILLVAVTFAVPDVSRHDQRRRLRHHVHLADVDEHALGRVPADHRVRRPVLLRRGVLDGGVADDVRLLARRSSPVRPHVLPQGDADPPRAGQRGDRRSPCCRGR